jgi:hypothetical protein
VTSPLAQSYGPPRLLTASEPEPADRYAEHVARSAARAEAWSVARFRADRVVRLAERVLAEVAR